MEVAKVDKVVAQIRKLDKNDSGQIPMETFEKLLCALWPDFLDGKSKEIRELVVLYKAESSGMLHYEKFLCLLYGVVPPPDELLRSWSVEELELLEPACDQPLLPGRKKTLSVLSRKMASANDLTESDRSRVSKMLDKNDGFFVQKLPFDVNESPAVKKSYFMMVARRMPDFPKPPDPQTLRVVTFNVQFLADLTGAGGWSGLINFIDGIHADVICLQEMIDQPNDQFPDLLPSVAGQDTKEMYGEKFGMAYGSCRLTSELLDGHSSVTEFLRAKKKHRAWFCPVWAEDIFGAPMGQMLIIPNGSRAELLEEPTSIGRLCPRFYAKDLDSVQKKHLSNKGAMVAKLKISGIEFRLANAHFSESSEAQRLVQAKRLLQELGALESPEGDGTFRSPALQKPIREFCVDSVSVVGAFRDGTFCSVDANPEDRSGAAWTAIKRRQKDVETDVPSVFCRQLPDDDLLQYFQRKHDPWSSDELSAFDKLCEIDGQQLPSAPLLLVGDLNCKRRADYTESQWDNLFGERTSDVTDYLERSGLRESPESLPFSVWGGSRCDYIFATPALGRGQWQTVPLSSSDHYPILVDFSLDAQSSHD